MMFLKLLPLLLSTLALVSIVLWLIPDETLASYMGKDSGAVGWMTAALIGSVALIPGFIAYPLCGILVNSGVAVICHCRFYYNIDDDRIPYPAHRSKVFWVEGEHYKKFGKPCRSIGDRTDNGHDPMKKVSGIHFPVVFSDTAGSFLPESILQQAKRLV
ncbi:MAG: hypothetical protein MZV63_00700 [Marinilabiliales bacterium]|nr:hypothetical protein [Marinilabiliales bacterium]